MDVGKSHRNTPEERYWKVQGSQNGLLTLHPVTDKITEFHKSLPVSISAQGSFTAFGHLTSRVCSTEVLVPAEMYSRDHMWKCFYVGNCPVWF